MRIVPSNRLMFQILTVSVFFFLTEAVVACSYSEGKESYVSEKLFYDDIAFYSSIVITILIFLTSLLSRFKHWWIAISTVVSIILYVFLNDFYFNDSCAFLTSMWIRYELGALLTLFSIQLFSLALSYRRKMNAIP